MTDTETAQVQQIREAVKARADRGRTHWEGCETDPRHRDCAIAFLLDAVARQQAEIDSLKAESVQALARHYGCGEHVSFSDAWRWLAERVEISRLVQAKVETHKSKAGTALEAVDDRLTALQAEIDRLRGERDERAGAAILNQKALNTARADLKSAESSLSALREAVSQLADLGRCARARYVQTSLQG